MVLDPIPQSLPVHFVGSRPQPPTSPTRPQSQTMVTPLSHMYLHVNVPQIDVQASQTITHTTHPHYLHIVTRLHCLIYYYTPAISVTIFWYYYTPTISKSPPFDITASTQYQNMVTRLHFLILSSYISIRIIHRRAGLAGVSGLCAYVR